MRQQATDSLPPSKIDRRQGRRGLPGVDALQRLVLGRERLGRREALWGYIFMLPWLCGFLLLTLGPFLVSLVMSFFEWRGFGTPEFVGLYNYEWILGRDRLFMKALEVTGAYAAMTVPLGIVLSLAIAMLLSQRLWGVEMLRAMFYLPSVVTGVAVAFMWLYILDPRNGPLNMLLQGVFGLQEPIPWLASPRWTLISFTMMSMWGVGSSIIIMLAGLKGVPRHLYEAAIIDGANVAQRQVHVTMPMLSPSLFYVLIILTIGAFQVLTQPLVIFGSESNGPMNSALFYSLYLYRTAFTEGRMGYASALAWILFMIILALTLFNFVVVGRRVYYED